MSRYAKIIERIFLERYNQGATEIPFEREEITAVARRLRIDLPKNVGDLIYSFRYRRELPRKILKTQPKGFEWTIEGAGRAKYVFKLVTANRIRPNPDLVEIKVPDATPQIIARYALSDEQALLAKVRYNRLVDVFLGIAAYSLQNHLRTTVTDVGQIEIDEMYVGLDKGGRQYVIPVQAKGGTDQHGAVQTKQDIACCQERFPELICRAVSAQFMSDDLIAMFELTLEDDRLRVVDERHYLLVNSDQISTEDLERYRSRN